MPRLRGTFAVGMMVAFGVGTAGAAGCLLTSDFDNVAGTRPDGGAADGPTDGGADADADAGGTPFSCTSAPHVLCTNFDEGPIDNGGWAVDKNGAASKVFLDTTQFRSPPSALHSTIGTANKGITVGAILRQTPTVGPFTRVTLAFDMNIQSCTSQGNGGSVTLAAIQPATLSAFGLVLIDTNVYTFAQVDLAKGTFTPTPFAIQPKTNTWQRISIRIDINATTAHAFVTLDGQRVVDVDEVPAAPSAGVLINIGANATGPISGCDVVYDNVTLDKE